MDRVVYKQGETFDDAINTMKYFIENRVAWLDKQFTSVENLLSSWGRYKGSNALTVSDIQTLESGETSITASVTNNNIKKIAFYVNAYPCGRSGCYKWKGSSCGG